MAVNLRGWVAELIATFTFVFLGTISVKVAVTILGGGSLSPAGLLIIALGHGLGIAIMIYAIGHVSGGHINPAVTVSMLATRRIGASDAVGYIVFQLIGATFASALHLSILGVDATQLGLHQPGVAIGRSEGIGLVVEILLTFFLVFTVFGAGVASRAAPGWMGFAVGFMVALLHLVGVPLTGASMNPARSFGPAAIVGNFNAHWLYWVGPIVGGVLAAVIYNYVLLKREERRI